MAKPSKDGRKAPDDPANGAARKARLIPPLLSLFSLYLTFCLLAERFGFDAGFLGSRLILLLSGLFGFAAALIPPTLAWLALRAREDLFSRRFRVRLLFAFLFLVSVASLFGGRAPVGEAYSRGLGLDGGGAVGSLVRGALSSSLGPVGTVLVSLLFPLFYFVFFPPARRVAFASIPLFHAGSKRGAAPTSPPKVRKEFSMSSRQSKPTIVGGDGYYPVAHREEENFSEIRARMEKEERTGAEVRGVPAPAPDEKRAQVDISIDPLPEEELILSRSAVSSPAGEPAPGAETPDVVSAAELFGKPGFAFTEEFNRTPPPSVRPEENVPLRAPSSEPPRTYAPAYREPPRTFIPDHTPIPPAYRPTFSDRQQAANPGVSPASGSGTPYVPTFRPAPFAPAGQTAAPIEPTRPTFRQPTPSIPTQPVQPTFTQASPAAQTVPPIQPTFTQATPTAQPVPPTVTPQPAPSFAPAGSPAQTASPAEPVQTAVPTAQPAQTVQAPVQSAPVEPTRPSEPLVAERNPFAYTVTERNVTDGAHSSGLEIETMRVSDASVSPERSGEPIPSNAVPAHDDPYADYCPPPLSLLKPGETKMTASSEEEIRRNAENLIETLESFNITATINHVSRGPRITRYELRPEKGIRIRSITNLIDDISMALATPGIRIEAPIPGVAAVGVEVPNKNSTAVRLRDMLDNDKFREAGSKTTVCVGSDVTGNPVYGDIAKMPHALIAGATGMGKSVCINSILISLLYKARPDEVKLILVDPKKVELGVYNGIPHLLVPVVVEPQKAAGALVWAVGEMERRFNLIEQTGVRNLKGYNQVVRDHPELGGTPLPQIVIVIDELNDLMMSARDAVEDAICRIAQKARAAGIHLLIGTQRPSVDVITGVIKANIPSRLAFHVASQVDSRTILDTGGAEKLLDRGDMLFFPVGSPKPIRVQGALVDDDEVERVTDFLKQGVPEDAAYDSEVMANIEREAEKCAPKDKRAERDGDGEGYSDDDDIFHDPQFIAAVEIAVNLGQISTSKIQTKLRIGFQKATNFIDRMEEMGIVGPHNGSKPRDVLISAAQFLEMKSRH